MVFRTATFALLVVILTTPGAVAFAQTDSSTQPSASRKDKASDAPIWFSSAIPLGLEKVIAKPSGTPMVLMATAESPAFRSWSATQADPHAIQTDDGRPVDFFPGTLDFRVTATLRTTEFTIGDGNSEEIPGELRDVIKKLQFRLRIFHGLHVTTLEPERIKILGVPMNIPYDERIWRISFKLPRTPITDRLVFEVAAPNGNRLARFHLEF